MFPTEETQAHRNYVLELVWYDHTLKPVNPEGRLPHGHAFAAYSMCASSRTDWNPVATPCVVYGKGGAAFETHGHHDAGQVCIDGYGEPLIIDPGGYGWSGSSSDFYTVAGHNVLMFDGQDMIENQPVVRPLFDMIEGRRTSPPLLAELMASEFDDKLGGYWVVDTTDVYDGVRQVLRTVVHLNPGVVVVLDTATLAEPRDVSLRWHTADKCQPDGDGGFVVRGGENVHLASRVVRLDDGALTVARGEHGRRRTGRRRRRRRTPPGYIEASLRGAHCTLLSLFNVFGPGTPPQSWRGSNGSWSIQTPEGLVDVKVSSDELSVAYRNSRRG